MTRGPNRGPTGLSERVDQFSGGRSGGQVTSSRRIRGSTGRVSREDQLLGGRSGRSRRADPPQRPGDRPAYRDIRRARSRRHPRRRSRSARTKRVRRIQSDETPLEGTSSQQTRPEVPENRAPREGSLYSSLRPVLRPVFAPPDVRSPATIREPFAGDLWRLAIPECPHPRSRRRPPTTSATTSPRGV